ncbi:MAG: phage tail protein [Proteobacteria bacterium]|nr:phage tail protein [Pseudomonadota bacterium]MBU1594260.1 phage tail protein [Pseudomonadota bacterium]
MSTAAAMPTIRPRLELSLSYDQGAIQADLAALSRVADGERKALSRAINKALNGTRTDIVADLRSRTVLKAGTIRKGIFVRTAWWKSHTQCNGIVRVSTSRLPLTEYKITPLRQTAQKRRLPAQYKHVSYRLSQGGKSFGNEAQVDGRSRLFTVRGAKSGKLGVYSRLGAGRLPILAETGPSLQAFYARTSRQQHIMNAADARFRKELRHQVAHLAGGGR